MALWSTGPPGDPTSIGHLMRGDLHGRPITPVCGVAREHTAREHHELLVTEQLHEASPVGLPRQANLEAFREHTDQVRTWGMATPTAVESQVTDPTG